jgi:hypothetical protein
MNYFPATALSMASMASMASMPAWSGANPDDTTGTHRFYEVRGAMLYTEIYGHGAPILFLHGGMTFFDDTFEKQRDYFASDHTSLPRGQLIIVPASNDGTFRQRPQLVNLAIREFLERSGSGTAAH